MTRTFFLFLLLALGAASCGDESPSDGGEPDVTWGGASHGVRCAITTQSASFAAGAKVPVAIRIENVSDGPVSLTLLPYFTLTDSFPRYMALTDIIGKDPDFGHNSRFVLTLDKGKSLTSEIDIASLLWALTIQSSPPVKKLYELVPVGSYTLRLEMEVAGESGETAIESNAVAFAVIN